MILSDLSIKKPVFAWMIMISLLLFGGIAFYRLGVSQNPDIDFPVVNIRLTWEGAAPEVMENEVVDPVEESIMTVEGIKKISSTTRFGTANVTAEFELSKDIDVAVQEVQTKLSQTQRRLPREMDPPSISKTNPEDRPIMWIGISGTRSSRDMAVYVRDHLMDRFQTLPGVGEVTLGGYTEPNLRVWLNPDKMLNLQITADDVTNAIEFQHAELPAGTLTGEREERNVRVMGEASSPMEFGRITIPQRVGQGIVWKTLRLEDIARVEEGQADVRRLSRTNGRTAVGMGIRKQRCSNAVDVARRVKARIEELKKDLPEGISVDVNFDSTRFIEDNLHELVFTLLLSVFFTSLVCWLFLGSFSSTINVFLAIPTALGGTFLVIYFLGFTLNTITLMAISLVIGIVVDDAIVVLENIVRHMENGRGRIEASVVGAREITFSVIVISSAVIAIFLPVAFMKGLIGKYFYQFGVTISVAVAFSLLEAITLAPMRCSQFLETGHTTWLGKNVEGFLKRLSEGYRLSLNWALSRRWTVLGVSAALFAGSLFLIKTLRKEMNPSQDMSIFMIRFQSAPGSSLAYTDELFKRVENYLAGKKEIKRYFGHVGGFGGGEVNTGMVFVTMRDYRERPRNPKRGRPLTQQEFMQAARRELKDLPGMNRVALQDPSQSFGGGAGSRGYPLEFSVRGPEWDRLGQLAETLRTKLLESGLAVDVDTSYRVGVPEVRVIPDRDKAAARGVTVASIARTINASIGGVRVGKYTQGGRRYDIRVSLADPDRRRPADISKVWVRNVRGELVPLSEVTRINETPALLSIQREDRERSVNVYGNVAPGQSQSEALAKAQRLAKEILPDGYHMVISGSAEQFRESFQQLIFALILGIAIAYMILGAQFNSFVHPFTILLALPFSLSGALAALWISDKSLNTMSLIGILLLMGIVKKNSILLVDFTNARRLAGHKVHDALQEACPLRLRPILMTSFAIMAGALPAALSLGPGAEMRSPMAVAVIGGVFVSTLLTLYVVPCAYSLMARLESRTKEARQSAVLAALGIDALSTVLVEGNDKKKS